MHVNKTIVKVNESIGHIDKTIQCEELDNINITNKFNKEAGKDKYKENLIENDIKDKKKTLKTSENIENARDGYVCIYLCGNHLLHLMYECACTAHDMTIVQMKDIGEIFNYEIKDIRSINRDIQNCIDSCHKKSSIRAAYPE